jgi:AraC family transcriptional regulator
MNDFNLALDNQLTPRFERSGPFNILGVSEQLDEFMAQKIPALWNKLMENYWSELPGKINEVGYGLCIDLDKGNCIYMAGGAVDEIKSLPEHLTAFVIPSQTYAIFTHQGEVHEIKQTVHRIFDEWLPESGHQLTSTDKNRLHFFERYSEDFNPITNEGVVEIWLPIK